MNEKLHFPCQIRSGKVLPLQGSIFQYPAKILFHHEKNYSAARQSAACSVRFLTKGKRPYTAKGTDSGNHSFL